MNEAKELKRADGKIRRAAIEGITANFRRLNTERLLLASDYVNSLASIDEEALRAAEKQAIEICGYNPTTVISDDEWEGQLRRNEQSLKIEEEEALV